MSGFCWFCFLTLVQEMIQLKMKHIKTEFMPPWLLLISYSEES